MPNNALALMETIFYHSYFGYPLTRFELLRWTPGGEMDLMELETALKMLEEKGIVEMDEGMVTTSNHHGGIGEQIAARHEGLRDALKKHRKVKWLVRFLSLIGSVEGVAICNSLAMHHTREEGDIDLFVLAKPGTLWRTRLLCLLPMMIFRQRPGEAGKHAVDMSFFVSSDFEGMDGFLYEQDRYFRTWMARLVPVFERGYGVFARFVKRNRGAVYGDGIMKRGHKLARRASAFRARGLPRLLIAPMTESFARRIQMQRLPSAIQEQIKSGDGKAVHVSKEALKFHTTDRRQEITDYIQLRMKLCEELL